MLRFLDPYTSLYQTDDDGEGRSLASEPGFWPSANGQKDPLAERPKARVMYNVFRTGEKPFPGYDPQSPSPLLVMGYGVRGKGERGMGNGGGSLSTRRLATSCSLRQSRRSIA